MPPGPTQIRANVFNGCTNLQTIELDQNSISVIVAGAFNSLIALRYCNAIRWMFRISGVGIAYHAEGVRGEGFGRWFWRLLHGCVEQLVVLGKSNDDRMLNVLNQ